MRWSRLALIWPVQTCNHVSIYFRSSLCLPISAHWEEIPGAADAFLLVGSFSGRGCELVVWLNVPSVSPTFMECLFSIYFSFFAGCFTGDN